MTTVLFACVHNAGRSQMAAAFFNSLADPARARAISAGTKPAETVHPEVVQVMGEVGIDLSTARTRALHTVPMHFVDMLITMGCDEDACPVAPDTEIEDWALEDPKGKPLATVRRVRDEIERRVGFLVAARGWQRAPGHADEPAPRRSRRGGPKP
jgi:arsenate reductase